MLLVTLQGGREQVSMRLRQIFCCVDSSPQIFVGQVLCVLASHGPKSMADYPVISVENAPPPFLHNTSSSPRGRVFFSFFFAPLPLRTPRGEILLRRLPTFSRLSPRHLFQVISPLLLSLVVVVGFVFVLWLFTRCIFCSSVSQTYPFHYDAVVLLPTNVP